MSVTLTITIGNTDYHPEDVPLAELAVLLGGVARSIQNESSGGGASHLVSLVGIRSASTHLVFELLQEGVRGGSRIVQALSTGAIGMLALSTQEVLSTTLNRYNGKQDVSFVIEGEGVSQKALIPADAPPLKVDRSRIATGDTERVVYVINAGGMQHGGKVRFPDGRILHIDANRENTEILGENLYKQVRIGGLATWQLPDWDLVKFSARSVEPFPAEPIVDVLKELAGVHREAFPRGGLMKFLAERDEDEDE